MSKIGPLHKTCPSICKHLSLWLNLNDQTKLSGPYLNRREAKLSELILFCWILLNVGVTILMNELNSPVHIWTGEKLNSSNYSYTILCYIKVSIQLCLQFFLGANSYEVFVQLASEQWIYDLSELVEVRVSWPGHLVIESILHLQLIYVIVLSFSHLLCFVHKEILFFSTGLFIKRFFLFIFIHKEVERLFFERRDSSLVGFSFASITTV